MVRASIPLPRDFALLMGSSPGFGSCPSDLVALFGLAFAPAPAKTALALPLRTQSLAHYAKGTLSPLPPYCVGWKSQEPNLKSQTITEFPIGKLVIWSLPGYWVLGHWLFPHRAQHGGRGSNLLYASHFRDCFIPLSGCFSPFPHGTIRYRSLHLFSLGRWSSQIQAGFHVSDRTQESSAASSPFVYGALTLYGRPFQGRSPKERRSAYGVLQPP